MRKIENVITDEVQQLFEHWAAVDENIKFEQSDEINCMDGRLGLGERSLF